MASQAQRKAYRRIKSKQRKAVRDRKARVAMKDEAITYKGGCCQACGYDTCRTALEFHHPDPGRKMGEIATMITNEASRQVIWAELDRTVLLCANCHREAHAGLLPEYMK